MMAVRSLSQAQTTIVRWVQRYAPEFVKRWNRFGTPTGQSWRVDETYLRIRGKRAYLYRGGSGRPDSRLHAPHQTRQDDLRCNVAFDSSELRRGTTLATESSSHAGMVLRLLVMLIIDMLHYRLPVVRDHYSAPS